MTHYTTQTTEIIQTTKDYNQTTTRRQSLTKAKKTIFLIKQCQGHIIS